MKTMCASGLRLLRLEIFVLFDTSSLLRFHRNTTIIILRTFHFRYMHLGTNQLSGTISVNITGLTGLR